MQLQGHGRKMFKVLIPIKSDKEDGKTRWMRVGSAFPAKDGTTAFNIFIDAMPTKGGNMFHVRELDEEDFKRKDQREDRRIDAPAVNDNALPF